ncbi:MAG: hypothetical protein M3O46_22255, partial [Myxococcota bacterium]|nr:hypothetical protein [Myxococcota bacterium]
HRRWRRLRAAMANHAQRRTLSQVGAAALAVGVALTGGCSLLFHADANQCSTNTDCTARGPSFTGFVCSQGTCITGARDATSRCTTDDDCADSGLGYTCTLAMCVAPLDGGAEVIAEAGREAETGGVAEAGREAGPDAASGCRTTADCTALMMANPTRRVDCDVSTNTCLVLTSDDCPYLIPDNYASAMGGILPPPPIFIGAFAKFAAGGSPTFHPSSLNYQLALNEFQINGPGIPAGPGTSAQGQVLGKRTPVAVLCGVDGMIDSAMSHLINDVHVPSIVSALPSAALNHIVTTYTSAQQKGIFVINAFSFDSTFTSISTNNLLWHMLGQPGDTAAAYGAFLPLVESYVRTRAPWNLGTTAPLKVATVTANAIALNDLAAAVSPVLTWNAGLDHAVASNTMNYLAVNINASTLNGTSLTDPNLNASIAIAKMQLLSFRPQVIVSFASEEFTKLIENLEIDWGNSFPLPFYLISEYNKGSTLLEADVPNWPYTNKRFAGIGIASTTNQQVLTDYEHRFTGAYQGRSDLLGQENFYDAMYFAVYSLVAAGRQPLTGTDIGAGMKLLISSSPPAYQVGPVDMGNIFTVLGLRQPFELIGALGPPNFDTATGARIGQGDVYCLGYTPNADAGTKYPYEYDVLRLSSPNGGPAPDGGSAFQGTFPCYPGIQ